MFWFFLIISLVGLWLLIDAQRKQNTDQTIANTKKIYKSINKILSNAQKRVNKLEKKSMGNLNEWTYTVTTPTNGGTVNGGTVNGGTVNGGTVNGGTVNDSAQIAQQPKKKKPKWRAIDEPFEPQG